MKDRIAVGICLLLVLVAAASPSRAQGVEATPSEQYLLELTNQTRAKVGAQPLAYSGLLNVSSERHTQWMLATNTFSHVGLNGTRGYDRMKLAGYVFTGSWLWGENIAWLSVRYPDGYADEIRQMHTNFLNSPTHYANVIKPGFKEMGVGFEVGKFQGWAATTVITENFAVSGSKVYLTGVAFRDLNSNGLYDIGEGISGAAVKITNAVSGASYATVTEAAGGYQLPLPAGSYSVSFNGNAPRAFVIGTKNVKMDWVQRA